MGNCLKTPTADDISLLRGSDSPTEGNDSSSLGPPPPYQVSCQNIMIRVIDPVVGQAQLLGH